MLTWKMFIYSKYKAAYLEKEKSKLFVFSRSKTSVWEVSIEYPMH